jgi:uncharacterized OsmC-like protein
MPNLHSVTFTVPRGGLGASALAGRPNATGSRQRSVIVTESGTGADTQHIQAGRHVLIADEPAWVGGDDLGATPFDLLLAALGACTSMTVRMYARRKSWPLRSITVGLAHGKIGAEDCASCQATTGHVDYIRRDLVVDGDLNSDQRARLAEIADKCPVHRMLGSEVVIDTVIHQPVRASA